MQFYYAELRMFECPLQFYEFEDLDRPVEDAHGHPVGMEWWGERAIGAEIVHASS